jgi:hypothetical protein
MAAEELIHFSFLAQLSQLANSPALSPPEPVAESPPSLKTERVFVACGEIPNRQTIRVPKPAL